MKTQQTKTERIPANWHDCEAAETQILKLQRDIKAVTAQRDYFAKANNSEQIRNRKLQHELGELADQLATASLQRDELLTVLKAVLPYAETESQSLADLGNTDREYEAEFERSLKALELANIAILNASRHGECSTNQ